MCIGPAFFCLTFYEKNSKFLQMDRHIQPIPQLITAICSKIVEMGGKSKQNDGF